MVVLSIMGIAIVVLSYTGTIGNMKFQFPSSEQNNADKRRLDQECCLSDSVACLSASVAFLGVSVSELRDTVLSKY